jgi:carbon storage regulator
MLVLSRQRDETIMIGDEIEITVVDIRGDKVRLGINAPSRIAVHRKEVYDAIKAENENASRLSDGDVLHRTLAPGPARNTRGAGAKASGLSPAARIGPTAVRPEAGAKGIASA